MQQLSADSIARDVAFLTELYWAIIAAGGDSPVAKLR
jgi:hypothetical protein